MNMEYEQSPAGFAQRAKDAEWERKQRLREYRVASRREKRNRKADEKKQRKLNATILRRMTRNPEKYNKNATRNRMRDIIAERHRIWQEAVKQAQRLAAVHDPSGAKFNVEAVTTLENGSVVTLIGLQRRKEREAEREAQKAAQENTELVKSGSPHETEVEEKAVQEPDLASEVPATTQDSINLERRALMGIDNPAGETVRNISKTQQRKLEKFTPKPPPQKPFIPDGIALPEGEEDWLALWHLSDEELERRVLREKRRKAAERKALRTKQQQGKVERRGARDEKRRVYREEKLAWKTIKEAEKQTRNRYKAIEEEEIKKIEVELNEANRKEGLECAAKLGFTLENVEGVNDIQPRVLGMKGKEVDFDKLEAAEKAAEARKSEKLKQSNRVDLGAIADESRATLIRAGDRDGNGEAPGDFLQFEGGEGQDYEELSYNHKVRRKLHRALDQAQIKKEMLVRQKALEHCEANGIEPPEVLKVPYKFGKIESHRTLESGELETAKQERVRKRMELVEYNKAAKVLRKQAKAVATEAGLRKFAILMGKDVVDADGDTNMADGDIQMSSESSSEEEEEKEENDDKRGSSDSDSD
ncbi:MAG: hypothetical protein M1812_004843 [Candelaria pacifica]|nr:MAG: hypothetical protein M1812_004843 [Candelaria pacifica]